MTGSPVLFIVDASGPRRVDPRGPHLAVTDWGVTRGDGIFESISVIAGRMPALEARFARLEASARALDLAPPDRLIWTDALRMAIDAHEPVDRLAVTIVMTRGVEGGDGSPTAWLLARAARDFTRIRRSGVSVVTLDRGYASDAAEGAPWLLLGAKHLSYATNAAALREASRRGADDVIFTSTDGFALEGPTSSLIVRRSELIESPAIDAGILAGTTQATAFAFFESRGFRTRFAAIEAADLVECDAIWLVSSVRQAVAVHTLDGRGMPVDDALTADLNRWLGDEARLE
ncbi:aminotransferase class IV [Agreia sp. VKM Ac-1783]|uniref:aminotransferase class IV n=1 Tax=Agreia sp. VKM Ac-1783 TaxID=1938889 RepID=UPI000A2AE915|nr:aminotransferase class IV [Agreia sp. VKM Ac-1783]SMQ68175.1 4-amino-4-deoxychorismate lyase [Agreia sp. VKM Ac-1783]